MSTGSISFFAREKPQGFIKPDTGGSDVLFYIANIAEGLANKLSPGFKVSYDLKTDSKGITTAQNLQIFVEVKK